MSFWGTLGKIALKVAPIAAAFIPGVGIPLAMAISGATSAASKKIEGGSWKDALVSGGLGAATGAVGAGALGSIGPSSGLLAKVGAGAAGKVGGTGAAGAFGSVLGNIGKDALGNAISGSGSSGQQPAGLNMASSNQAVPRQGLGPSPAVGGSSVMPRGGYNFQNNPVNQLNQNSPNLAQSIFQGRQEAMKDQPFRAGYAVTMPNGQPVPAGSPAGTPFPTSTTYMPRISSDVRYGPGLFSYDQPSQQRRPRWNYGPPTPPSVDMSE